MNEQMKVNSNVVNGGNDGVASFQITMSVF